MLDKGKNPSFVARRSVTSEDVVSPDEEFYLLSEVSFLNTGIVDVVVLQEGLESLLLLLDAFRIPLHRPEC